MSFALKLNRAREHLQRLDFEIQVWINSNPHGIVDEPDPNPPPQHIRPPTVETYPGVLTDLPPIYWRRFRINRSEPVPERFSLLIGDCLFNLRSSLDHLALSLARAYTPRMRPTEVSGSEFPIFGDNKMDSKSEARKIGCIAPAARDIIKALQPYHRGNAYHADPLWQIHELNRIDKHRTLTVCASNAMSEGHPCIGITGVTKTEKMELSSMGTFISTPGEVKLDAIMAQYEVIGQPQMNMQPVLTVEITFGKNGPAPLEPVVPTLKALCDFVSDPVIAQLAKFL